MYPTKKWTKKVDCKSARFAFSSFLAFPFFFPARGRKQVLVSLNTPYRNKNGRN